MQQESPGGVPAAGVAPQAARRRFPWRAWAAPPIGSVAVVLLISGLAAACTVRIELAERRAITGDLAASSAGLAGRPDEDLIQRAQGIAIAALMPRHPAAGPIELLPADGGRSGPGAGDRDPGPAVPPAPGPVVRPPAPPALGRAMAPLPSPAKPVLLPLHRAGPAPRASNNTLVIEGLLPAAGPPFPSRP